MPEICSPGTTAIFRRGVMPAALGLVRDLFEKEGSLGNDRGSDHTVQFRSHASRVAEMGFSFPELSF